MAVLTRPSGACGIGVWSFPAVIVAGRGVKLAMYCFLTSLPRSSHPVVRQCQRELVMAIGGFSNCFDSCLNLFGRAFCGQACFFFSDFFLISFSNP